MNLFQLAYVSSATTPFGKGDLINLLKESRSNNEEAGVTGLLLYQEETFLQVLEGSEAEVRETYDRISQDPRHTGLKVMYAEGAVEQEFPDWSMAFRNLTDPELAKLPGYNEFLNTRIAELGKKGDLQRARRLVALFCDHFRS